MKNFIKKVSYLALFIVSGIVFQISCSNSEDNLTENTQSNKILFYRSNATGNGFYLSDYDGSNEVHIPVTLPTGSFITTTTVSPHLSPDGTKFFFVVIDSANNSQDIYSCNVDGTNLQQVVTSGQSGIIALGNAN
ncbi:MAG: hypothetical protein JNJ52_11300 [Flavobacterium sp.]|nr:hypothetical protein [Flavobacterium sp.]